MKISWAVRVAVAVVACSMWGGLAAKQQQVDLSRPTVAMVQSVGCVSREAGTPPTWWLTSATDATETETPYASNNEIEGLRNASPGSNRFQLIGVADFLDAEGALNQFQRGDFTASESVNATGQLVAGHRVAVKGLFLEATDPQRINLTSVISLADSCS